MPGDQRIGVLGASSHVGAALLPLLADAGFEVAAFSRKPILSTKPNITWRLVETLHPEAGCQDIAHWICLAPIWVLPDYFAAFQANQVKRIVVLSSTSRFSKQHSPNPSEQALVQRLVNAEQELHRWAAKTGVEYVVLRPTLIYGLGKDKNIREIARLIRRFGFFPLLGAANGLRQPVHCGDVAQACVSALVSEDAANRSYNLSGADTLSYKEMVTRIFDAMHVKPRFFKIPLPALRVGFALLKLLPRYRNWSFSMLERTNQDLVFDHQDAVRDLGFDPRPFRLESEDLD